MTHLLTAAAAASAAFYVARQVGRIEGYERTVQWMLENGGGMPGAPTRVPA